MTLLLSPWFWLAFAVAAAGFLGNGWLDEKAAFDSFKGGVSALAEQAQERAALTNKLRKAQKEKTDAKHSQTRAALTVALDSMRKQHAGSGGLSAPAPSPASPDRVCFDPAKLAGALRSLDEGVQGIVGSCAQAVNDLDATKQWAQDLKQTEGATQ